MISANSNITIEQSAGYQCTFQVPNASIISTIQWCINGAYHSNGNFSINSTTCNGTLQDQFTSNSTFITHGCLDGAKITITCVVTVRINAVDTWFNVSNSTVLFIQGKL